MIGWVEFFVLCILGIEFCKLILVVLISFVLEFVSWLSVFKRLWVLVLIWVIFCMMWFFGDVFVDVVSCVCEIFIREEFFIGGVWDRFIL